MDTTTTIPRVLRSLTHKSTNSLLKDPEPMTTRSLSRPSRPNSLPAQVRYPLYPTEQFYLQPTPVVYVPFLQKYFIMEDLCGQCSKDWANGKCHMDMWIGPQASVNPHGLAACEDHVTQSSTPIYVNPPNNFQVDTTPIFSSSGQCTAVFHNPNQFGIVGGGDGGDGSSSTTGGDGGSTTGGDGSTSGSYGSGSTTGGGDGSSY